MIFCFLIARLSIISGEVCFERIADIILERVFLVKTSTFPECRKNV